MHLRLCIISVFLLCLAIAVEAKCKSGRCIVRICSGGRGVDRRCKTAPRPKGQLPHCSQLRYPPPIYLPAWPTAPVAPVVVLLPGPSSPSTSGIIVVPGSSGKLGEPGYTITLPGGSTPQLVYVIPGPPRAPAPDHLRVCIPAGPNAVQCFLPSRPRESVPGELIPASSPYQPIHICIDASQEELHIIGAQGRACYPAASTQPGQPFRPPIPPQIVVLPGDESSSAPGFSVLIPSVPSVPPRPPTFIYLPGAPVIPQPPAVVFLIPGPQKDQSQPPVRVCVPRGGFNVRCFTPNDHSGGIPGTVRTNGPIAPGQPLQNPLICLESDEDEWHIANRLGQRIGKNICYSIVATQPGRPAPVPRQELQGDPSYVIVVPRDPGRPVRTEPQRGFPVSPSSELITVYLPYQPKHTEQPSVIYVISSEPNPDDSGLPNYGFCIPIDESLVKCLFPYGPPLPGERQVNSDNASQPFFGNNLCVRHTSRKICYTAVAARPNEPVNAPAALGQTREPRQIIIVPGSPSHPGQSERVIIIPGYPGQSGSPGREYVIPGAAGSAGEAPGTIYIPAAPGKPGYPVTIVLLPFQSELTEQPSVVYLILSPKGIQQRTSARFCIPVWKNEVLCLSATSPSVRGRLVPSSPAADGSVRYMSICLNEDNQCYSAIPAAPFKPVYPPNNDGSGMGIIVVIPGSLARPGRPGHVILIPGRPAQPGQPDQVITIPGIPGTPGSPSKVITIPGYPGRPGIPEQIISTPTDVVKPETQQRPATAPRRSGVYDNIPAGIRTEDTEDEYPLVPSGGRRIYKSSEESSSESKSHHHKSSSEEIVSD